MSLIEMLSRKIQEHEPTLDILGADRKVLQVASQDLTNYLKFSWSSEEKETNILDQNYKMERLQKEDPAEIEAFLTVWSGLWLKKWRERVNLLLDRRSEEKISQTPQAITKAESLWQELNCREEMLEIVSAALIRNAEICGTKVIAESLIKSELCKKTDKDINSREQVLEVVNNALRQGRKMASKTGPLISIKVDKDYYLEYEQIGRSVFKKPNQFV